MADFLTAFNITNKNEGGYSNNPSDSGGETYGGVSRNNWPNWAGWKLIDQHKETRGVAGINQTMAENPFMQQYLEQFYKQNFWNPLQLDEFEDQQLANAVYDFGVNAGVGRSAKFLQEAVDQNGVNITIDGKIGNHTIDAVNNHPADAIYNSFNTLRSDFYHNLATKPGQHQFLASWMNRIKPYIS